MFNLSNLNSEINSYINEGKKNQIDELFNSPISLENVVTQSNQNDKIILLNYHIYNSTELESLKVCPMTRRKINECDKIDVTDAIKEIWANIT